ncbi:hypothetical protein [Rhizobium leguminosarum]|uniref:hypothetical protein n=1 Tax=Rhizobium leguminosarum TaxID=384 RepID=UPI003F9A8598
MILHETPQSALENQVIKIPTEAGQSVARKRSRLRENSNSDRYVDQICLLEKPRNVATATVADWMPTRFREHVKDDDWMAPILLRDFGDWHMIIPEGVER